MENDTIRTIGDRTVVDLWIEGKFRAVSISRRAIETHLRVPEHGEGLTPEDVCSRFVRAHLKLVVETAKAVLVGNPDAAAIEIDEFCSDASPAPGESG